MTLLSGQSGGIAEIGVPDALNRHQLLKIGYEWLDVEHQGGVRNNVLGVQLVTSIHPLNWAFR